MSAVQTPPRLPGTGARPLEALRRGEAGFEPGDEAPPLEVLTLDSPSSPIPLSSLYPVVVNVLDLSSLFSRSLWSTNASIDGLIHRCPREGVNFVFIAAVNSSAEATEEVSALRQRFLARISHGGGNHGAGDGEQGAEAGSMWVMERLHFVTQPLAELHWLPELLEAWPTTKDVLSVKTTGDT